MRRVFVVPPFVMARHSSAGKEHVRALGSTNCLLAGRLLDRGAPGGAVTGDGHLTSRKTGILPGCLGSTASTGLLHNASAWGTAPSSVYLASHLFVSYYAPASHTWPTTNSPHSERVVDHRPNRPSRPARPTLKPRPLLWLVPRLNGDRKGRGGSGRGDTRRITLSKNYYWATVARSLRHDCASHRRLSSQTSESTLRLAATCADGVKKVSQEKGSRPLITIYPSGHVSLCKAAHNGCRVDSATFTTSNTPGVQVFIATIVVVALTEQLSLPYSLSLMLPCNPFTSTTVSSPRPSVSTPMTLCSLFRSAAAGVYPHEFRGLGDTPKWYPCALDALQPFQWMLSAHQATDVLSVQRLGSYFVRTAKHPNPLCRPAIRSSRSIVSRNDLRDHPHCAGRTSRRRFRCGSPLHLGMQTRQL
ncbi:hypothetical protein P171DRAFT_109794 [Karstenula rhodostoma CBS 690.94]|uniref:Uncharacterized protein n=1 Tax=Karstenula rhodostoma CBS 690.94 TaxID=1392251 RepID=A0A9P4P7A7_9PLEO|nr:hypothetical protein P171DRAFT_109794 [Karstenula rhodostoma CBS 690.94]